MMTGLLFKFRNKNGKHFFGRSATHNFDFVRENAIF